SNGAITTPIACSRPLPRHLVAIISLDNQRPPTLTLFPYTTLFRSTLTNSSTAAVGVNVALGRTLSAGSVVNNAGATIANDGTLSANTITNNANGTITSKIGRASCRERAKSEAVNAQGEIKGTSKKRRGSTLSVTGKLGGDSTFDNNDTATLNVTRGEFAGETALRLRSTGVLGVTVALGRTLSAGSVVNNAGATIANDGTLSANTITNNANGTITS